MRALEGDERINVEAHECPACGLRFRHASPNACTACGRVHCRNCLKVFRDEMEEELAGRFIVLCSECEDSISWRVDAQEVFASNWSEYGG